MTTAETPERHAQRMASLALGNSIRLGRAGIRRQVYNGELRVAWLVKNPPECILTMTIYDLLRAQYRWGKHRTMRTLSRVVVGRDRLIGNLTKREREALIRELEARGL